MSLPRHLRKKRPKPRPNSRPGRLDLTSVKLGSSALGRCQQSQFARAFVVDRLLLRTNQGGIEQAKRTQFPAGGKGWWWSRGGRTVVTGSRTVASESVSQGDNAL